MKQLGRALIAALLVIGFGCGGPDGSADAGRDSQTGQPDGSMDSAPVSVCGASSDCDDGVYCNGFETCAPGEDGAGADGCVPGADPCSAGEFCDEGADTCVADVRAMVTTAMTVRAAEPFC